MTQFALQGLLSSLRDPYGFSEAFRDFHALAPEDLPTWTRDCRLDGVGC